MRGKAPPHAVKRRLSGITPAYAGKSAFLVGVVGDFGDHPRVCGEKASFTNVLACGEGSPPRMRGKVHCPHEPAQSLRITPAYAGKSETGRLQGHQTRDHPRVCGEKCMSRCYSRRAAGSPPRMRGKGAFLCWGSRQDGITPAYAGKRDPQAGSHAHAQDHPRVCGEKIACGHYMLCYSGSPPRMRGKGAHYAKTDYTPRITPAYAGKSIIPDAIVQMFQDHPRVCGEKGLTMMYKAPTEGSPPRMRGKD